MKVFNRENWQAVWKVFLPVLVILAVVSVIFGTHVLCDQTANTLIQNSSKLQTELTKACGSLDVVQRTWDDGHIQTGYFCMEPSGRLFLVSNPLSKVVYASVDERKYDKNINGAIRLCQSHGFVGASFEAGLFCVDVNGHLVPYYNKAVLFGSTVGDKVFIKAKPPAAPAK